MHGVVQASSVQFNSAPHGCRLMSLDNAAFDGGLCMELRTESCSLCPGGSSCACKSSPEQKEAVQESDEMRAGKVCPLRTLHSKLVSAPSTMSRTALYVARNIEVVAHRHLSRQHCQCTAERCQLLNSQCEGKLASKPVGCDSNAKTEQDSSNTEGYTQTSTRSSPPWNRQGGTSYEPS
mmetsp:Transcript_46702/g.111070  ORF Transcript_46702/g.111070 Transcript_46702/m.111070 type:complete len:179 (+) Transcript_46702:86-622(+)